MKTIAQQLNIKDFPFIIRNRQGDMIYYEDSSGFWERWCCDLVDNAKYYENSNGYWSKREYDSSNNMIYYENSDGEIEDNRPKEDEIITLNGKKYKRIDQ